MSARRSAGASLTPSPVIATTWPSARSASAMRSFASGELRAKISSVAVAQELVELALAHRVELVAGDDARAVARDADPPGDLGRGRAVVAGDDDDADAGRVAARDRVGDLGPRRVEAARRARGGRGRARRPRGARAARRRRAGAAGRRRARAGPAPRSARATVEHAGAVGVVERHVAVRRRRSRSQRASTSSGAPLAWTRQAAVVALVDGRHQPQLRVEAVELPPVVLAPGDVDVDAERARGLEQRRSRSPRRATSGRSASSSAVLQAAIARAEQRRATGSAATRRDVAPSRGRARRAASRRATARIRFSVSVPVLSVQITVGRAERLDRAQPLDERAAAGERARRRRRARA